MKDEMELIEQGYMIEALSPRTYGDLVYFNNHKDVTMETWTKEDILGSLPIPFYNDRTRDTLIRHLLEAVKAKERFERRIETIRIQAIAVKR